MARFLIDLAANPNQDIIVTFEGFRYDILLRSNDGFMTYDMTVKDLSEPNSEPAPVIIGARFVTGEFMIPYRYLVRAGNFILDIPDRAIADYRQFGVTQNLYYFDSAELVALRGN